MSTNDSILGLTGRTVIVTGAAGDIGAEYCRGFLAAGARVVATDLAGTRDQWRTAVGECHPGLVDGRSITFVECDVTDDDDLNRLVSRAVTDFGGIDVLVNNAAIYHTLGPKRPLTELTPADWDRVLTVNVRGTWQAIKAVQPTMAEHGAGSIVNVSSTVVRAGVPGFSHYVASKGAVDGLTRAAAKELGGDHIRVNSVAPGLVSDTATLAINPDGYAQVSARTRSLAREMQPHDLTGAVLWLASPLSSFVSGQTIIVDGGQVFA